MVRVPDLSSSISLNTWPGDILTNSSATCRCLFLMLLMPPPPPAPGGRRAFHERPDAGLGEGVAKGESSCSDSTAPHLEHLRRFAMRSSSLSFSTSDFRSSDSFPSFSTSTVLTSTSFSTTTTFSLSPTFSPSADCSPIVSDSTSSLSRLISSSYLVFSALFSATSFFSFSRASCISLSFPHWSCPIKSSFFCSSCTCVSRLARSDLSESMSEFLASSSSRKRWFSSLSR
mmetsp:Transcript_4641/g.10838  ORF Transcript_4641/g.10838 Transcript_4641/m.10838 type:complete len:230 (+) Transcript_4641:453-1142(+)